MNVIKLTLIAASASIGFALISAPDAVYAMDNQTVISFVNAERQKAGLQALTINVSLQKSSLVKGTHMINNDYWSHNSPEGSEPWHFFEESGYAYILAGENLAKSFASAEGVVKGWMDSPSHKANILGTQYKEIGVAAIDGTLLGEHTTLVVAHFGARQDTPNKLSEQPTPVYDVVAANLSLNQPAPKNHVWQKFLQEILLWFEPRPLVLAYESPRLNGFFPAFWRA